jgi:hypothetical protein
MEAPEDTEWVTQTRKRLREEHDAYALWLVQLAASLEDGKKRMREEYWQRHRNGYTGYAAQLQALKDAIKLCISELRYHELCWVVLTNTDIAVLSTFPVPRALYVAKEWTDDYPVRDVKRIPWTGDATHDVKSTLTEDIRRWAAAVGIEVSLDDHVDKSGGPEYVRVPFSPTGLCMPPFGPLAAMKRGDIFTGVRVHTDGCDCLGM